MLGSLIPSSKFLINHLLEQIDFQRARVIVEFGPGVGTITQRVLPRLHPSAKLVVIEMNADFVRYLKQTNGDERLQVVHGSAADVDRILRQLDLPPADYIISGIPFTTMTDTVRESLLHKTRNALAPTGSFLVYQFTRAVRPDLHRIFGNVREEFEPLNILPARLYYCRP